MEREREREKEKESKVHLPRDYDCLYVVAKRKRIWLPPELCTVAQEWRSSRAAT